MANVTLRKDSKKHAPPKPGLHPHPVVPPQRGHPGTPEPPPTRLPKREAPEPPKRGGRS